MLATEGRTYLVDASIYIFRAWFSLPDRWHTSQGMPLNAVYGYGGFLLDLLDRVVGSPLAFAFDESLGSCFRNDIYPGYKASRELPDEALAFQLDSCRKATELLGIPCFSGSRYEADDYLATLARLHRQQGQQIAVLTRDKDLGQLIVGPGDLWWNFSADEALDASAFAERFGVAPARFADYLALVGDPVDDIPGVPGVGAKTAAALLNRFDNLPAILADTQAVAGSGIRSAGRIASTLAQYRDQVSVARQLTALFDAIEGVEAVPAYRPSGADVAALAEYFETLGLAETALHRRCATMANSL